MATSAAADSLGVDCAGSALGAPERSTLESAECSEHGPIGFDQASHVASSPTCSTAGWPELCDVHRRCTDPKLPRLCCNTQIRACSARRCSPVERACAQLSIYRYSPVWIRPPPLRARNSTGLSRGPVYPAQFEGDTLSLRIRNRTGLAREPADPAPD